MLKYLLLPFSLLYGAAVLIRNKLYDYDWLTSTSFTIPVIAVGNLTVGGTGKTPHVEYILRVLRRHYSMATLSRGYGRKTKGFLVADAYLTALETGDEPQQYFRKFKTITVAVDEDRVHGVNTLLKLTNAPQVIVLDDAYQHRALKPGFSILLTDYTSLYADDWLLPTGRLREGKAGAKRANCIVVTKTPATLTEEQQTAIIRKLNPLATQSIYFTYFRYGQLTALTPAAEQLAPDLEKSTAIVLTGIANPQPLLKHIISQVAALIPVIYTDHHVFTAAELQKLSEQFNAITSPHKLIITTEKDAMRLLVPKLHSCIKQLPIYYLPVEVTFQGDKAITFEKELLEYVKRDNRNK